MWSARNTARLCSTDSVIIHAADDEAPRWAGRKPSWYIQSKAYVLGLTSKVPSAGLSAADGTGPIAREVGRRSSIQTTGRLG